VTGVSRTDLLVRVEAEVGVLIRRVRRVIGERARAVHASLQPSAYLLLMHLAEIGPSRSSMVADVFEIDKGAISRQVQHLVDLGLVERQADPDDGRATLLSVTEGARARLADVAQSRRSLLDERLGGWSDDDLDELGTALGRYNRALDPAPVRT
jgi:DNA-binding MarR family transcriptional regulator